jgi:hypothetical protein
MRNPLSSLKHPKFQTKQMKHLLARHKSLNYNADFDPWLFEKDIEPNTPFKGIGTFHGIDEHF